MNEEQIRNYAIQTAMRAGIPVALFLAQIGQESGFRTNAVSYAGAAGVSQFMPATARQYGLRVDNQVDERLNPQKAIAAQAKMMVDLYGRYGSWERALSAYNSGRPDAYQNPNFAKGQTYNYVRSIMGNQKLYAQTAVPQQTTQPTAKPVSPWIPRVSTVQAAEVPPQTIQRQSYPQMQSTPQPMGQYVVQPGDTLSKIAQQYLGDASKYSQLSGYRSGNPNLIYPGERITW